MMYLLDTDHVTLDQHGHPLVSARIRLVGSAQVTISVVTVEEQLRGWLAVIRNATSAHKRTMAYAQLRTAVSYFATFMLLDYTLAADTRVADLRQQRIRIGTQDLRIAAIALTNHATLVTRNTRDFNQIPGLLIEDWSLNDANAPGRTF
jgi:tRNA(fMet)-specific endonuclease VapC